MVAVAISGVPARSTARTKVRTTAPWERPLHPLLAGAAARDDFAELIGEDPAEALFG